MDYLVTLVMLIIGFGLSAWAALYGISLHLLGRHLRRHHPREWKDLGAPDLATAQGPRPQPLARWLGRDRYLKLRDPALERWVPRLRKIPTVGAAVIGSFTLLALLAALMLAKR